MAKRTFLAAVFIILCLGCYSKNECIQGRILLDATKVTFRNENNVITHNQWWRETYPGVYDFAVGIASWNTEQGMIHYSKLRYSDWFFPPPERHILNNSERTEYVREQALIYDTIHSMHPGQLWRMVRNGKENSNAETEKE